jgi:hypothetical protein
MRSRTRIFVAVATLALFGALTTAALAVSPHLKGKNPITFTDNGLTLTAKASYSGLGNFTTQQNVAATAQPTSDCVNPSGQHKPPGQNPAEANVTGSTTIPASDIKNGNVTITTSTNAPVTPIPGSPDCPGVNWTENITDMAFTSATITVFQDANANGIFEASELVLTVNCTFSPATSDGSVPASGFTCTEA